jgi:phosphomannomutase
MKVTFVTNLASSLIFDALAEKYNTEIIRTPVGERNLADKMDYLMKEKQKKTSMIFGGEGSCGGVMIPHFNNTRDGIFAAAKIVEILVETQEKISKLVSKLPKFYSFREYINIENKNLERILSTLKETLISEGQTIAQFDMDIRIAFEHDWFVLVHPSNTEPIIRVISEAKSENIARINLEKMVERLKFIIT